MSSEERGYARADHTWQQAFPCPWVWEPLRFLCCWGGIIGACCGIYGSRFDSIVMRLCDVLNCVPGLLFALAVVAALGSSMRNLLIAVTIVSLPALSGSYGR